MSQVKWSEKLKLVSVVQNMQILILAAALIRCIAKSNSPSVGEHVRRKKRPSVCSRCGSIDQLINWLIISPGLRSTLGASARFSLAVRQSCGLTIKFVD